jgi:arsenate reductase (glutaredoxin)
MTNGTIKFFNATKGFGFITPEDGSKDVFVPAASVTASGISGLKPGQLVSFDTEPDSKGPKAVNLKLLADAPKAPPPVRMPVRENPPAPDAGASWLTVFHDPASDASGAVLATLKAAGHDPRLVDYMATPPDRDALKNLSFLLRGGDQSLVRKYDPLFLELRLDDRFISDGEFWAAIVEHPSLINGPVVATAQKARVCRTESSVKAFLGIEYSTERPTAAKPKGIPARPAPSADAAVTAPVLKAQETKETEAGPEKPSTQAPVLKKVKAEAKAKPLSKVKAETKTKIKTAPKAKAKAAAKTVPTAKPVKKSAAKPVKKAKRPSKR